MGWIARGEDLPLRGLLWARAGEGLAGWQGTSSGGERVGGHLKDTN